MILRAKSVTKKFRDGRCGLEASSLKVETGEYICIVGKSGCGKTTFLNILSGMLSPTSGVVYIENKDIYKELSEEKRTLLRNSKIGYMNYGNCLMENLTVWENLIFPIKLKGYRFEKQKLEEILNKLDIAEVKNAYPWQLSAGEYRRVCLGRVLALDTDILILDEPTSNLDEKSATIIADIISELNSDKGIIVATHDKLLMKGKIITM